MRILPRRRLFAILIFFLFILGVRLAAPRVTLYFANQYLAEFSPIYRGHIADLNFYLWRGAYRFEGVSLTMKDRPLTFATVRDVDVSVAWRELLRLHVRVDVVVSEAQLLYSDSLRKEIFQQPQVHKKDAQSALSKLVPLGVERIRVLDSSLGTADFFGISEKLPAAISGFSATINHLTTDAKHPVMYFEAQGKVSGDSIMQVAGDLNTFQKEKTGSVKMNLQSFDIRRLNPWMIHLLPLSFEKGLLTVYTEVKIQGADVTGYLKPFLHDLHIVGDKMDFTSLRQFGVELSVSLLNSLFQDKDDDLAAQIDFKYTDGKLDWNFWDILKSMIKNSRKNNLKKSFNSH